MSNDTISLPRLPAALPELTAAESPDYRQLWHLAVSGRFPISMIRGRYQIRRGDLPEIAKKLGRLCCNLWRRARGATNRVR